MSQPGDETPSLLKALWDKSGDAARQNLQRLGDAASTAAGTAARWGSAAWETSTDWAATGARKVAAMGLLGTEAAVVVTAKVGGGAALAAVDTAQKVIGGVANAGKAIKETFSPSMPVKKPCLPCMDKEPGAERIARMKRRQALIDQGKASASPGAKAAAQQLQDDMKAVELGKLSANTYDQYDPEKQGSDKSPPEPWKVATPQQLDEMGLDPQQVAKAKAVVYQAPSDFPFTPKTVVAFRGTTSEPGDILADHDQALGLRNEQYDAAVQLGKSMRLNDIDAEVTGHSLGGGKAQACGVAGGYSGQMFNSAGLHPNVVGQTAQSLQQESSKFIQYRAEGGLSKGYGDPLTGMQNSPAMQKAVLGVVKGGAGLIEANTWAAKELGMSDPQGWAIGKLPQEAQGLVRDLTDRVLNVTTQEAQNNFQLSGGKWYIPPALGEVRGLTSKNPDGSDSSLKDQHSILRLNDGFEHRKADSIETLISETAAPGPTSLYIGPMK